MVQFVASVRPITITVLKDSENAHIYHSELLLTEKMAKGEPQKLYFTAHTTHTELLDLKPLRVTALANGTYEALYRFTHFNPILTEVWMKLANPPCCFPAIFSIYNQLLYQNVLLRAPTGSGKSISAQLAMLHLFNMQSDLKVVFSPIRLMGKSHVVPELSSLGEQMVHSSEGKRALALELFPELDDKYIGFLLILSPLLQMPHQALEDIILIKARIDRQQREVVKTF
ncbi:hypothetical protein SASPL_111886 [Salvia splendens]|uniref:DEAD/DEAH-box helicase domain-containing protein n=1 Tax=Salvia splendens TaxID=180675 RepID=A0A8X8YCS4_SALSN|nr:hypothetical protein SASPL_111886 [Salvia splendens]